MKRTCKVMIAFMLLFVMLGQAGYAKEAEGHYSVVLDGQVIALKFSPIKAGNTLRVNAEELFTADGLSWSLKDKQLSASKQGLTMQLTIGSKYASVNGFSVNLKEGVRLINNQYMITLEDYAALADKQLSVNAAGNKFFLRSHLQDRILSLLHNKKHTITYEGEQYGSNIKHGTGKLFVNGMLLYEGQFAHDVMSGLGKLYLDGKLTYTGGFQDNLPHGAGVYYLSTGERYEGMMEEGRMQGVGKLYRGDRLLYDGDWSKDRMHGIGKVYNAQGHLIYEGELRNNIRNGYGIAYNASTGVKTYRGDWVNGKREGYGLVFDDSGNLTLLGTFKDDALNGEGAKVTFGTVGWFTGEGINRKVVNKETAYLYRGLFVDGMMVSPTDTLIYTSIGAVQEDDDDDDDQSTAIRAFDQNKVPDGIGLVYLFTGHIMSVDGVLNGNNLIYQGEMKDGQRHGQGRAYLDGNLAYDGEFVKDKRNGQGKAYENGLLVYDGEWRNNNRSGKGRTFQYVGDVAQLTANSHQVIIREVSYVANQLRNIEATYKYSGELREGRITGSGVLYRIHSVSSVGPFASSGVLHYSGDFVDGRYHGTGRLFNNGSLVFSGQFVDHKRNGQGIEYINGLRKFEGNFVDDVREGQGRSFAVAGETEEYIGNFKNGLRDGYGKLYRSGVLHYEGNFKAGLKHGFGILYKGSSIEYEGEFINDKRADGKE